MEQWSDSYLASSIPYMQFHGRQPLSVAASQDRTTIQGSNCLRALLVWLPDSQHLAGRWVNQGAGLDGLMIEFNRALLL